MRVLLHSSEANRRRSGARLRRAILLALAIGAVVPAASSAEPLSRDLTSPVAAIASPGPVPGRYIVTFAPGTSVSDESASIAAESPSTAV